MFIKLLFVLVITAFLPFQINAEWVSLSKNNASNTPPKVTLHSDDNNSTVIKIDILGFDLTEFKAGRKMLIME
ncbi:MAG: hypothetical protein GXO89_17030 [Chlorobi bacterium]|nr:hypothetical protein [Chlorobiota bacterium]